MVSIINYLFEEVLEIDRKNDKIVKKDAKKYKYAPHWPAIIGTSLVGGVGAPLIAHSRGVKDPKILAGLGLASGAAHGLITHGLIRKVVKKEDKLNEV